MNTVRIDALKSELQKAKQSLGEWTDEALRLEGELQDREKDLAAAQERLAEMREALTESVAAVEALLMDAPTTMLERVDYQDIIDNAKQALSVAPAGGRVLLSRRLALSKIADGQLEIRLGLGELDFTETLELGPGAEFVFTVTEIPCPSD